MELYTNHNKETSLLTAMQKHKPKRLLEIASPFLTETPFLKQLLSEGCCQIRIIVKLCTQTSITALQYLLAYKNAEIRYFIENSFHAKIYIFDGIYAILGSSNFTNGGLIQNDKEANVGLSSEDDGFDSVLKVFNDYWKEAKQLDKKSLEVFTKLRTSIVAPPLDDLSAFDKQLEKMLALQPNLSKLDKLSPESRKKQQISVKQSLSKPVVCLNSKTSYSSIKEASELKYHHTRASDYISAVCRGKRKHYKNDIWVFSDDYKEMTSFDIIQRLQSISKETDHKQTKYMVNGIVFNRQAEIIRYLQEKYNHTLDRQTLSLKKREAERNAEHNFILYIENMPIDIVFAEYYQIKEGKTLKEEVPVEKGLEEYQALLKG